MDKQPHALRPFDMARLVELRELRGPNDSLRLFWKELESVLQDQYTKSNEWKKMVQSDIVKGEVWQQYIGAFYYRHTRHWFSYLYVETSGLAIDWHRNTEPANRGKQSRKVKEWYVLPDGTALFCGKDQMHQLFNEHEGPIYVLSIKTGSKGTR